MALDRLTKVDGGGISTTSDYRVGIITASKFVGPFDGTGGNFSGVVTATNGVFSGNISAVDGNFSGNVSIGGTLTYEDVTNIDSVGIITARDGIDCNGDLDVDGHTNLDNVSVAGVSTFTGNVDFSAGVDVLGNLTVSNTEPYILLQDTNNDDDFIIRNTNGVFTIRDATNGSDRLTISSSGKTTFPNDVELSSILTIESTQPTIQLNDTNANDDFAIRNVDGVFGVRDITNGADRFTINSSGVVNIPGNTDFGAGIDVTGNATVSGNLSVGGVLTYEDVTNVDSVGIVTARSGLRVTGGTSHFVGVANFNETIVGTARTAIKLTCTDESTDTTTYPLFVAATTGDQFPKTGNNLSFNSANGTLTATTFSGSGASLTSLPAANLTGTAAAINGSNITNVNAASVGGIGAGSSLRSDATDVFNCNGYNLSFDFDTSGRDSISFTQGGSLRFQLVHSNSGNDIDILKHGSAADLKIAGARILTTADEGTGNGLDADTVDGIQGSNIMTLSGTQTIAGTKTFNCSGYDVQLDYDNARTLVSILRSSTEKVRLYTSGDTIIVETFNSGVIRWKSGLVPNADDTYDLGATGTRWRNLYVNDLQLSNESKKDKGGNDVDGTWGDWTLQEGDENIFMLNNRTGKKYKMNLTEVE